MSNKGSALHLSSPASSDERTTSRGWAAGLLGPGGSAIRKSLATCVPAMSTLPWKEVGRCPGLFCR